MGFTENYLALWGKDKKGANNQSKKKKKKETTGHSFTDNYLSLMEEEEDIAPVAVSSPLFVNKTAPLFNDDSVAPITVGSLSSKKEEEDERKWFEKGAFEDGYQFGDVIKTILGTSDDLKENLLTGVLGMGEKTVDAGAYIVGGIGGLLGNEKFQSDTAEFIKKDLYNEEEIAKKIVSSSLSSRFNSLIGGNSEESSLLGEKSDALVQSAGQLAGTMGLQLAGVPWFVTSGVVGFGNEVENALNEGASYGKAGLSATISAGAEILTEKLFGGSGLGETGLIAVDSLTKGISNKVVKALADYGVDVLAEGSEEVVSQFLSNLGSSLYKEKKLGEILFSEEAIDGYIESFIGGGVLGGVMNASNAINSVRTGRDYRSGLSANEQKVVQKEVENRIAEQEQNGKKLTSKEKAAIEEAVARDMERGYISTDTIEEVLGGDTYTMHRDTIAREQEMQEEYDALYKMKNGDKSDEQIDRQAELKQQLEDIKQNFNRNQLGDEVMSLVNGSRLAESYNERARRGQAYEADLTKYTSKQKETIQKAIDSGILNNTNRTHEFVDMVAKITADKGVLFDFTNNERLKESGFAVDGKAVNGYVTKDGVTLNIDSAKSLNSVVGHEITHVLEGTEFYDTLKQTITQYAKSKGDYQSRYDALAKLYESVDGADVDAELTADLVGDYLFTDREFIRNLSVTNKNVFQKVWDEIKYLYKVATAGSKEARELEKLKKAFEDAYREGGKQQNGTKYSLGYHAGDLGKAEGYWNMVSSNRSTGHFGTGTYFVGDEAQISDGTYGKRPHEKVEFDNYHLFKPLYEQEGFNLHDSLKYINDSISLYPIASMSFEEAYEIRKSAEAVDDVLYWDDDATEAEKNEARKTLDTLKERFESIGYDPETWDSEKLYEEISDIRRDYRHTKTELSMIFGVGDDFDAREAKIDSILKQVYDEVSKIGDAYDARYEDSPSTRFMKALGYEGIDVRGFKGLDNTKYGSVIYDLKGEDAKRKAEIGTAKYSLSDSDGKAQGDTKFSVSAETDGKQTTDIIDSLYNYDTVNLDRTVVDWNKEHFAEQWKKGYYTSVVDSIAKHTGKSNQEVWNAFADVLLKNEGIAKVDGKTYINVHELNEEQLREVFELGGLAAPSIGIVDVDNPVTGFGDIALIFPDIFNPETVPTHYGDSYSTSFPAVAKFTDRTALEDALTYGFDGMEYGGILTTEEMYDLLNDLDQFYIYDERQRTSHSISKNGFRNAKEFAGNYSVKSIDGLLKLYRGLDGKYESYEQFLEDFAEKAFTNKRAHRINTEPEFVWNDRTGKFRPYDLDEVVDEMTARGDDDFNFTRAERATNYDELLSPGMRARLKAESRGLYEAKPQRAVYLGEATYAVVPESTSADVIEMLENEGVEVVKYQRKDGYDGIAEGRAEAIKGILEKDTTGVRFSLSDSDSKQLTKEQQDYTTESEVQFSLSKDTEYMDNAIAANNSSLTVDSNIMAETKALRERIAARMNDIKDRGLVALPDDVEGNTYIANSSYDGTEENTTICPRSLASEAFVDAVSEYLGRPLTVEEQIYISQDLQGRTLTPECLYCYVATDRKAYRAFLGDYVAQRDAVLEKIKANPNEDVSRSGEMYREFLSGRKDTNPMYNRFKMWVDVYRNGKPMVDASHLANINKLMGDINSEFGAELKPQIVDAMKYAQSASWAKKRVNYVAYNGHILKWKQDRINKLNSHYGLRMYSFSDFHPAFVLENMQMITDASVRGLKMLGYTKDTDFVEIFAPSGMNINVSTFGFESGGEVFENNLTGADWETAKRLREQYPNVGVTFVATNDTLVNWALNQDWIDVVIPYHLVRTGAEVAKALEYTNYTSESSDTKTAEWTKGDAKYIAPTVHNNDKATYLAALEKNHLKPRFERFLDNPNYMKLVNECRQPASQSKPVQPVFNEDAAMVALAKLEANGYYQPIGGSVDRMYEIAGEVAESMRQELAPAMSLSEEGETPKQYGNFNTYGEDIALETQLNSENATLNAESEVPVAESQLFPDDIAPMPEDEETAQARLASLTDADAPAETEAPYTEDEDVTVDDPFEERDWYEVGNRKVKAYMYENPEVKPFFQEEAANLLGELQNTIKGEKWYNAQMDYDYGTEAAWGGTKRFTSESIAEMLDGWRMSYADIEKGLNAIIEDNGAENIAAAKKIEFMLNERLLNGYKDFYSNGRIPPNEDYLNLLHEKEITEYSKEAFDRFMETADDYAPAEEVVEDIAPVVEKPAKEAYEAIRPKPEKEPRMARATPAEQARAEILVDEPKVEKKKNGVMAKIRNLVLDKGMVFEDLSLKTGNRELQARWDSIRRAEGRAQRLMESGNTSAGSLKSIRESVEQTGKTKQFYEYLYHLHNVDRMTLEDRYEDTQNKPVFGYSVTAETSREAANKLEKANPEFKQFAQDVYNYMGYLREMLVDGGVISGETAKLWAEMYPHYVPIRRVGDEGLNINVPLDTGRTGVNAPVKRATGGNRDILPLFDTMGQRTIQTYKAIAKNRFGVELKNTLGTTIDSDALSLDEAIDSMDAQDLLQEGKDGRSPTFTVFENGEKVTFEITDEMYDAMKPKSDALAYTNKTLNTISNLRRGVITEYNPWFLLKNAVKDTQDVLINSQHAVQTYAAIPKALKQMSTNGHWYQEYLDNGGDQDTYFDSETNTVKEENKTVELLKKVTGLDFISKANNVIERLPRLAEYIASRESGRSVDVSMLDAARVTTNFAAGGDLTKFLNRNGATFLNASVQGAMQNVRNVREAKMNGLKGWASLAGKFVAAGLPAIVLNHFIWDDDEEYDELSDYVKQNYYIVGKYGDGKFVRIPKGRTVAVIQNAIEQVSNAVTGNDEADLGSFIELVISNLAPTNPIDNNILSPIIQVANNETWYGEDLVPTRLQDLPSAEQYDETTDSISRWLGETFDVSPYKVNYLLDQYSGVLGDTFLPMLTPEAESGNDSILGNMIAPLKDMFTTDSVLKNQNVSDFYDLKDELTVNANASGATDEDVLMSKYMNSVNAELAKLYAEKRKIQNSDLSDAEKYAAVRDVQKQIVELTKDGMDTYSDISFEDDYREGGEYARVGDRLYKLNDEGEWQKLSDEQITKYEVTKAAGDASYATDGENHYRWYEPGEDADADAEPGWRKVTDKELERQEEVTSGLGITADEYWSNKEEYAYAYDHPENYSVAKAVGGYEAYRNYSSELYDIKADKDANGKSISGSRKEKVLEYINNLDADYYTKIILWKSEYTSDDTYNYEIIDYLNGRDDISFDDMVSILRKLGFNVTDDGNITW